MEDNPGDVILVRESLTGLGVSFDLEVLRDGEEAIAWLVDLERHPQAEAPSVILLDLNLPKRTGIEVLRALRNSTRCRELPVMVVSSSDNDADRRQVAQLGASAYFRKPSDLDEFLALGNAVYQLYKNHARALNSTAG